MEGTFSALIMDGFSVCGLTTSRVLGNMQTVKTAARRRTPPGGSMREFGIRPWHENILDRHTERYKGECESTRLVQGSPDCWAHNQTDAKKGLEDGKHGGHIFWELLCNHAEGSSFKTTISTGLYYPEKLNTTKRPYSISE